MGKIISVIGAVAFIAAVAVGNFASFASAEIIEMALAAFGLCSVIISAITKARQEEKFSWKTVAVIALAVIGGTLCCIGGLSNSVFSELSGLVLALLAVITGLMAYKQEEKS